MARRARWLSLAGFLGASFAAAGVGTIPTVPALAGWYAGLKKPAWNPPNKVFGPVWSTLYTLMGVAGWIAWQDRPSRRRSAATFSTQLVLNAAWPWFFFGRRSPRAGAISIAGLWLAVGVTTASFFSSRRAAGLLLLPYWAWVSYAASLNIAIWRLNANQKQR